MQRKEFKILLFPLIPWLLIACGSGSTMPQSVKLTGNLQDVSLKNNSKIVAFSVSSTPVYTLSETNLVGNEFSLDLPEQLNEAALGGIINVPSGCSGINIQPPAATAAWLKLGLENADQRLGEIFGRTAASEGRFVYVKEAVSVSGTLSCAAPTNLGLQPLSGTTFNLNLVPGWNLVLTDAQETSFSSAPLTTVLTWGLSTSNNVLEATGSDMGSSSALVKGTLGVPGYTMGLQILTPQNNAPSQPLASPVLTTGVSGEFNFALPTTLNTSLLGATSGVNTAGCTGQIAVNPTSAVTGQLLTSIYRGREVIGKAKLVTFSSTFHWWYAPSVTTIVGQQGCNTGAVQYNLSLVAGWNLISETRDSIRKTTVWTNLTAIPSDAKWLPEIEDDSFGVFPGAVGGADNGSSAAQVSGTLGGWSEVAAAALKFESDAGVELASGTVSSSGEFQLKLPSTISDSSLAPLELTQGCQSVPISPSNALGARASLEPIRDGVPLGTITAGGRGYTVSWVYAASAVQLAGTEVCELGDGQSEEHRYRIAFTQGWNILIEQAYFKNGIEYTEHRSGTVPTGTQWYFEIDKDPGLADTGSTLTTLSGLVDRSFANKSVRVSVGSQQIASVTVGAAGDVFATLPATLPANKLTPLNVTRAACGGSINVSPSQKFGVLNLNVWDANTFKSVIEISNEESDGALEKIYWWYLEADTTVSGTQTCVGEINRTFKYNLALKIGWNLVLEHEQEDPSGDRDTKYSVINQIPVGTRWGTN